MNTDKIIIYGAGVRGKAYLNYFKSKNKDSLIYGFCDKNYVNLQEVKGKKVYSYEEVKNLGIPFLLSVVDAEASETIKAMLQEDGNIFCSIGELAEIFGNSDNVEFNREICSFFHDHEMDEYYEAAEREENINIFWGSETTFYHMFKQLDISNVIELACGRGRHVPQYIKDAGHITLVDIVQDNMDYCRERFQDYDTITYYCNNGYNLEKLEDEKYTALFTYDAMVHFELLDIYEYLQDIYRVLVHGGKALIHHSNNGSDYKASFSNAPSGRSFMSKNLFAHMAYRCGFTIVEQKVIDWEIEGLDCITLLEKR